MTRHDVAQFAQKLLAAPESDLEKLRFAAGLAISEACEQYLPVKRTQRLETVGGKLEFTAFSAFPLKIYKVADEFGRNLRYRREADGLALSAPYAVVTYAYEPGENEDVFLPVSLRVLAFGAAAEYLLAASRYEEATLYAERFEAGLRAAWGKKSEMTVKSRGWR